MNDTKQIDNVFIIFVVLFMATIFALYKIYQTEVTSQNFIRGVYLYILLSIVFITLLSQYTATLSITDSQNVGKMIILYLITAFASLSLIFNNNIYVNHLGLLLLCMSISLTMGVTYKNSKNINEALILTTIIVFGLTMITFSSNETQLLSFTSWLPSLTMILCLVIIVELGYMLFFGINETFHKIMAGTVVLLFSGFILADTAKLMLDSKDLGCVTHSCINYPKNVVNLLLDYINIFVRMNDYK